MIHFFARFLDALTIIFILLLFKIRVYELLLYRFLMQDCYRVDRLYLLGHNFLRKYYIYDGILCKISPKRRSLVINVLSCIWPSVLTSQLVSKLG